MSFRKRLLRIFAILLLVALFAGYFAFSTFVFSPTEGDYEPDVSTLVPRDVDFFVAKSELRRDFDGDLRLRVQGELEATPAWQAWVGSPEHAALQQELRLDEKLAEVRAELGKLGVDPLRIVGGRDLALAGYFRGPTFESADWAAWARCNWMGKLAVAALRYGLPIAMPVYVDAGARSWFEALFRTPFEVLADQSPRWRRYLLSLAGEARGLIAALG